MGPAESAPATDHAVNVGGRAVIPGFVDSHSHLVFAGDRSREFAARMTGEPYTAGGIRTTVAATREASGETLATQVARHVSQMAGQGTTTVEIKSEYGLTVCDEARGLAVARQFTVETTYLGAHVVPEEYADDPAGYVDLVAGPILEACAPHARWIDVFCETGAFDDDQARTILNAGKAAGLLPRVHANQLGHGPGVQLACEVGAAAADHCTYLSVADVDALAQSGVVAGLLPGVEFSTRSPYPDARRLLDAGVIISLASDCNPGSSYTSSMPLCISRSPCARCTCRRPRRCGPRRVAAHGRCSETTSATWAWAGPPSRTSPCTDAPTYLHPGLSSWRPTRPVDVVAWASAGLTTSKVCLMSEPL